MSRSAIASLRAFAAHKPVAQERCDFCGVAVASEHGHVLDAQGAPRCACQACALLFPEQRISQYQRLEPRAQPLSPDVCTDAQWAALGIPVGLAWLFRDASDGRVRAMYPGAAGPVEARADALNCDVALIDQLQPGIEALLVRRGRGDTQCWRVSMDHCWRLAGLLRRHWRGFEGGADVHARVEQFFRELGS